MIKQLVILSVISIMICSCKEKKTGPDVSTQNDKIEIIRFDRLIAQMDSTNYKDQLMDQFNKHPKFAELYYSQIMPFQKDGDLDSIMIKSFVSDPRIKKLLDTVELVFKDFENLENDFKKTAQYFRHYFPKIELPRFYTLISEYGFQNFIFNDGNKDGVGIGLDMYLGSNYPYKALDPTNPNFSDYLTRTYNKQHLIKKSFEPVIQDLLGDANGKRMIDMMVFEGKKLYIMEKIMPFISDTILMEYTPDQLNWVKDNELEIWTYFLDKNLLYETSLMKTNRYINPAPTSLGMPDESPGRTGAYIGRQIVRKYMDKYPEKTLFDLIAEFDAQKILTDSRYKPKRK